MKKGLLLSVVASTVIFAGGDIAPVQPEVVAPAADCSDFSGVVGLYYETSADSDAKGDDELFGKNVSTLEIAAALHVEKEIANGIGFGVSAGGWTAITRESFKNPGHPNGYDGAALGELYLTGTYGNTSAKIGRFSLPGSLSPLLSGDDSNGVINTSYEGVLVANTDLADTVLYGVWVSAVVKDNVRAKYNDNSGDLVGAFAAGFRNTSFAGTTITGVGYYAPEALGGNDDATAAVLTVATSIENYGVTGQVAYIDGGADNGDATIAAAVKVSAKYDMFNAWAQFEYINDGDYAINHFGGHESLMADADGGVGPDVMAIKAGLNNIQLGIGALYVSGEYRTWGDNTKTENKDTTQAIATVGYDFKVSGIAFNAEYEYSSKDTGAKDTIDTSTISLEAVYKF